MFTCLLAHVSLHQDCEDRPTHAGHSLFTWAWSAMRGWVEGGGGATPLPSTPDSKPSVGEFGVQGPAPRASITRSV